MYYVPRKKIAKLRQLCVCLARAKGEGGNTRVVSSLIPSELHAILSRTPQKVHNCAEATKNGEVMRYFRTKVRKVDVTFTSFRGVHVNHSDSNQQFIFSCSCVKHEWFSTLEIFTFWT